MYSFIRKLHFFLLLLFPPALPAQPYRFAFSSMKMGAPFGLIFYHTDSAYARQAAAACFRLVDSLEQIFSDYSVNSEVGRINAVSDTGWVSLSPELFYLLEESVLAWKKSAGAFDVTIGALSQLWRKAKIRGFPEQSVVRDAHDRCGFSRIMLNKEQSQMKRDKPGIQLDFGGIVPGYIADRVIQFLHQCNIHQALVDASGDIVVSNAPPGKKGWLVAVGKPESESATWDKQLFLENCAVSTSGDVYRYLLHEGKKYSHIIDPRTGYGVTRLQNVTVIARNGISADWMATACSILTQKKARKLARSENAELMIATAGKKGIRMYKSRKFDQYSETKIP